MPLTPLKKLEVFQKIFVDHFMKEFNFLGEVAAGYATAKNDFTDNLCKVITLGITIGGAALDTVVPMAGTVSTEAINEGLGYVNDGRKAERAERIGRMHDLLAMDARDWARQQDQLRLLAESVAREAAYRYQATIVDLLNDDPLEAIVPLAKVSVERTLEFVARENLELTEENLLQGLIEGRSGAFVIQCFNTNLATKELRSKESNFTAEGILGRSPFQGPDSEYYVLEKDQALHKEKIEKLTASQIQTILKKAREEKNQDLKSPSKWVKFKAHLRSAHVETLIKLTDKQIDNILKSCYDYGYVHFEKGTGGKLVPKYPFVHMPMKWITHYKYEEMSTTTSSRKDFAAKSIARIKVVNKEDVKNYLKYISTANQTITFNAYIAQKYDKAEIAACHTDLRGLNLSGGDFSGSDFNKCIIDGPLKGTKFNGSYLRDVTFDKGTIATGVEFVGAYLEYAKAEGIDFTGANLSQAYLSYSKLKGAQLTNIKSFSTDWFGADLTDVINEDLDKIKEQQNNKLIKLEKKLKHKITVLKDRVEKQSKEISRVKESIEKLEQTSQKQAEELETILNNLLTEHNLRETFELYCRTELAALNENITQLSTAEKKPIEDLEKRLGELEKTQQQLPQMLAKIASLATEMQNQKEESTKLQEDLSLLKKTSEEYIAHQSLQIISLHEGLTGLEISVKDLEARVAKIEETTVEAQQYGIAQNVEMHNEASVNVRKEDVDKKFKGSHTAVSKLLSNKIDPSWSTMLSAPTKTDSKGEEKKKTPAPLAHDLKMFDQAKFAHEEVVANVIFDLTETDDGEEAFKEVTNSK